MGGTARTPPNLLDAAQTASDTALAHVTGVQVLPREYPPESDDPAVVCEAGVREEAPEPEVLPNGRDSRGRFVRGRPGPRLDTAARSALVQQGALPEQAAIRAVLREQEQGIVADLGGDLATVKRGVVEAYVRLRYTEEHLFARLLRDGGPITGKGRTRASLTAWLAVLDRLERHAKLLGLERRSRDVSDDIEAYIDQEPAHVAPRATTEAADHPNIGPPDGPSTGRGDGPED